MTDEERAKYKESFNLPHPPQWGKLFEGDPLPNEIDSDGWQSMSEHEFRTRNFGLRTVLQAEGAEPSFVEAYARCMSVQEKATLALKEIEFLGGVIRTHENINRSLVERQTEIIARYRGLHRAHQRLVGSFWERLKFLFWC